jgi:hypothetical protein
MCSGHYDGKYGVANPSTNDNGGVYTCETNGWYFTEKYNQLAEKGLLSSLDALYVGAFIEELVMIDINQCPKLIIGTDNGINEESECAKVYTDKADLQRLYGSLLEGSENHLRAFVKNIEKGIGEGSYLAQVFTQGQVNAMLGR